MNCPTINMCITWTRLRATAADEQWDRLILRWVWLWWIFTPAFKQYTLSLLAKSALTSLLTYWIVQSLPRCMFAIHNTKTKDITKGAPCDYNYRRHTLQKYSQTVCLWYASVMHFSCVSSSSLFNFNDALFWEIMLERSISISNDLQSN